MSQKYLKMDNSCNIKTSK